MRNAFLALILIMGLLLFAGCSGENGTGISATEAVTATSTASATAVDYSGDWQGTLALSLVSGSCPAGSTNNVTVSISQKDDTATMNILSGFKCDPAAVCNYSCTVSGNRMSCANSGVADDEGGRYSNTYEVVFQSGGSASGSGTSAYSHPSGYNCSWNATLELSRS